MTTIYHGYTEDMQVKPATKEQLQALLEYLISKPRSEFRDKAVDALDNAIDCIQQLADWECGDGDCADLKATEQSALGTLM